MQGTWVRSLSREEALEKKTETHSSILAWEIPQAVEATVHGVAVRHNLMTKQQLDSLHADCYSILYNRAF